MARRQHPLYELIAARGRIDWNRVDVFWSDERCVPPDHPAGNYGLTVATLLARAAPTPEHMHRNATERGCAEAAAFYDAELATFFGAQRPALLTQPAFDLVLLGMGADGHTASLFPGGAELTRQIVRQPPMQERERVPLWSRSIPWSDSGLDPIG